MAVDDEKTIELRGGPLDGQRAKIPARNTRVSLPVNTADKYGAWASYLPTKERSPEGFEVWDEYVESEFGDTGLADL